MTTKMEMPWKLAGCAAVNSRYTQHEDEKPSSTLRSTHKNLTGVSSCVVIVLAYIGYVGYLFYWLVCVSKFKWNEQGNKANTIDDTEMTMKTSIENNPCDIGISNDGVSSIELVDLSNSNVNISPDSLSSDVINKTPTKAIDNCRRTLGDIKIGINNWLGDLLYGPSKVKELEEMELLERKDVGWKVLLEKWSARAKMLISSYQIISQVSFCYITCICLGYMSNWLYVWIHVSPCCSVYFST